MFEHHVTFECLDTLYIFQFIYFTTFTEQDSFRTLLSVVQDILVGSDIRVCLEFMWDETLTSIIFHDSLQFKVAFIRVLYSLQAYLYAEENLAEKKQFGFVLYIYKQSLKPITAYILQAEPAEL